jgi:hypothetical protein
VSSRLCGQEWSLPKQKKMLPPGMSTAWNNILFKKKPQKNTKKRFGFLCLACVQKNSAILPGRWERVDLGEEREKFFCLF